ncbi:MULTISPECIES: acyltransferase [Streptomyces]|uniref:Acyltransferase n=1 Tax=Streptomyces doudnae TaxID=3075536 RepID=A0ABD5ENN3_9ACTN|nr:MULTISPECIES: acyltransferase [unclassified Streptomyces]MDT0436243.1 acyltransferase [Streptomyces sp. DSM 41981]MYQ67924.1 acyltransferase family protein [Streptomyces sp. SID4950]SCE41403.1 Peptidoglycan/LPS O-acetylase OafA/YrhL, contains acyltransferase and SGNH-hydrolase domains [Streptomyces sp. SolWspMP-5a-2]
MTASTTAIERSRLPALTGARFLAACMVLVCHVGIALIPRLGGTRAHDAQRYVEAAGNVGVSFFFVLSGFILTWVSRPEDTARRFWRRRLVKIFPNHLVTLAAALLLMLSASVPITAINTVPTVFLVQSWIPEQDAVINYGGNAPSWSLACELLFYLSFPLLLRVARGIRPGHLWRWLAGTAVLIALVPLVAGLLPARPTMPLTNDHWWAVWFTYYFPVTRLLEFALGVLTALIVMRGRRLPFGVVPALALAVVAFVAGAHLPGVFDRVAATSLPLALLIGALARADTGDRVRVLGSRPLVRLGEISYSLYLVHYLVVAYGPIGAVHPENWAKPVSLAGVFGYGALTLAISLVLAWLLYTCVEAPAMRRFSRPRPPKAAARPAETAPQPSAPGT